MLRVICCHCRQPLDITWGWAVARCSHCGTDPRISPPDEDELPEDDDPTDEWETEEGKR